MAAEHGGAGLGGARGRGAGRGCGLCCGGAAGQGHAGAGAWRPAKRRWRNGAAARARARRRLGLGHGRGKAWIYNPPNVTEKETEKSPQDARDPLTGRSGGSDRTLPPSVRSIPERSKSSGIATGCVRWSMTGRRQGPVSTACPFFIDRTLDPF